jgi:NAD(P)-dependent dehydrogenase (short-subunit alcohol dehydrogenase family)
MSNCRTNLPDYEDPIRPSRSLEGKVAIVTGAGSRSAGIGNGRAAAILLAEAGASVVCVDINLKWAKVTVSMIEEEFGVGMAVEVEADVVKEDDCKRVVATAIKKYGHLDILINNVGVAGPQGTAVDVEPTEWAKGFEVNVSSMMLMVKYAVPEMEKNTLHGIFGRGSIVNIASVAGLLGGTPMLLYHTSKGAVVNMTRAMAVHHGPVGIRVNCVCPGGFFFNLYCSSASHRNRHATHSDGVYS